MISLNKIEKSYDNNKILRNFSYDFIQGKKYVITGESGSGKSTLLNIIGMLVKPDSGSIIINDIKNPELGSRKGRMLLKHNISYMFQNYGLVENENIISNLQLVNAENKSLNKIHEVLHKVGLKGFEHRKVCTLSGGEQQRVAVAKILLKEADIILADEPTGNLDQKMSKEILKLLLDIVDNDDKKILIMVTHEKEFISYFDEVINISKKAD